MVTRKLSPLAVITIILIAIIVICILNPGVISFLIVLIALLIAVALMAIHLALAWRGLTVTARFSVFLSIVAWLALFCGMVHSNGFII